METFLGEIRLFAFDFVPRDFIICDGKRLNKSDYSKLYTFLGDRFTYDTSDTTTFAIPDLRNRFVKHPGTTIALGERKGADEVVLTMEQMPKHNHETHVIVDDTTGGDEVVNKPKNAFLNNNAYRFSSAASADTYLGGLSQEDVGNSTPLPIKNASVKMVYAICIKGVFIPSSATIVPGFMGDIRIWPSTIIPRTWNVCDGATYSIAGNSGLGTIIGFKYGIKDGNPMLPDFRDRLATGASTIDAAGEKGGKIDVLLSKSQLPPHKHNVKLAVNNNSDSTPHVQIPNNTFINSEAGAFSTEVSVAANLGGITQEDRGGSKGIDITNSALGLTYIICTVGDFNPSKELAFKGEIKLYAGTDASSFNDRGFALCQGQVLPINQNSSLFALLGHRYGDSGNSNFKLPNIIEKLPTCCANFDEVGTYVGANKIQLTTENLPKHNHNVKLTANFTGDGRVLTIPNAVLNKDAGPFSTKQSESAYLGGVEEIHFPGAKIDIRNPYLGINYLICTDGIFPSRN